MRVKKDIKNFLKRIGLKGSFDASSLDSPVSRDYQKSATLSNARIGLDNIGQLTNIKPRLIFNVPQKSIVLNSSDVKITKTWKVVQDNNGYSLASYNLKYPYAVNAFHFFHFGQQNIRPESNNFFKKNTELFEKFRRFESNRWKKNPNSLEYGKTPLSLRLEKEDTDLNKLQISGVSRSIIYGYNDLPFVRLATPVPNEFNFYAQCIERNHELDQVKFTDFSERKSIGFVKLDLDPLALTGFNKYLRGLSGIGTDPKSLSKNSKLRQYLHWNPSMGSGLTQSDIRLSTQMSNINLLDPVTCPSGFYVPFPNSVTLNKAYPVKCDTKISFIDNYKENLEIKGLLVVSTGNRTNGVSSICYVSPHKINPILANTVVNYYNPETISTVQSGSSINKTVFKNETSIMQVHALEVTSEFNNFKQVYNNIPDNYSNINPDFDAIGKNGLVNLGPYSYVDNTTFTRRSVSRYSYLFNVSHHLQQITPLSKTPFYKLYRNLYTGSKNINTGTWDGIIPSGTFVTVELLTTTFEKEVGINLDAALVYKNYGSNDSLDQEIIRTFEPVNFKDLFGKTNITKDGYFSYTSYATDEDQSTAEIVAKINANKRINKLLAKAFRLKIPSIVILNRKFRKLESFNNRVKTRILSGIGAQNPPASPGSPQLNQSVSLQKIPSIYKKEIITYEQ